MKLVCGNILRVYYDVASVLRNHDRGRFAYPHMKVYFRA